MMTKNLILFAVLVVATAFFSCTKNKDNSLTPDQTVLLSKMKVAYNNADAYNNLLISNSTMATPDTSMMNYNDSCYHANDSMFMACHSAMMNSGGGIMGDNGGMMDGNSSMMGNNNDSSICSTHNGELNQVMNDMSQLRQKHLEYNPK